jgi:hypothetical protein
MPKRVYLLGALVVLLAAVAAKLWVNGSWRDRETGQQEASAAIAQASSDANSHAEAQPRSFETLSQAGEQHQGNSQALISNPFVSATKANSQNGPQAVFSETAYDGGTIDAGTELTHTFKVKNTGKTDLLIESVKPG